MRIELTEMIWFEQHALSRSELAEISGLSFELLDELVGCGVIAPLAEISEPRFGARALHTARSAQRLRHDFELDTPALLLALGLLERVDALTAQLRELQAKLPNSQR